jgi:methylthioribose-1-phosphate isomerase
LHESIGSLRLTTFFAWHIQPSMTEPNTEVTPIVWRDGKLLLLDQRKLPGREQYLMCRGAKETARAIKSMVVRGAPAIGVTAAYGLAVEASRFRKSSLHADFDTAAEVLAEARPTAVNLIWAIERMRTLMAEVPEGTNPKEVAALFADEAQRMHAQDIEINRSMGRHGAELLDGGRDLITHCNAGALATAGYGTALGVIRSAWEGGGRFGVYATETRPYLQGARLTSWELQKLGIPVTLITDSMVGHLFQHRDIEAVVVGTDRTAANGDVANKIGTYQIAVLARRHGVAFYVAAPTSSIDIDCPTGADIPIEERDPSEITHFGGRRVAAENISVFNPAFDVTPAELVSGIITEHGVVKGDYVKGLAEKVAAGRRARS